MANPLSNEKEYFADLDEQSVTIDSDIWGFIYHRIVDDISAINFYCARSLTPRRPIPVDDVHKILFYARDISNVSRIITATSTEELAFPQFAGALPLHPIIRELFSHQIGNDIYAIELMVQDSVNPSNPVDLPVETGEKIIAHGLSIREFMEKLRDVTYRKTGQGQLHESERRFRNLYDSFTYGLLRTDLRGRIIEFNRAFQDMIGYSKEELWTMRYAQLVSLPSLDNEHSLLEQVFRAGSSEDFIEEYICKDGRRLQVEVRKWLIYDEQQLPGGMWVICRDISGKEIYQQKMIAEALECKHLLDKMGDGVTLSDRSGKFEIFNRKMKELTGYTIEEANNSGDFSLLVYPDPLQRAKALAGIEAVVREGSMPETETVIQHKDGAPRTLLVSTSLVSFQKREMFLSVYHDITGKLQMQQATRYLASFPELDPFPVMELDSSGKAVYSNPAAKKILAIEERKRSFLMNLGTAWKILERMKDKCFSREVHVDERWYTQVVSYLPETRHVRVYSLDSTEQKKAELGQVEALRQWRATFDAIEEMICILSPEGKIIKCNSGMQQLLGRNSWDIVGNYCWEIVHEDRRRPENCPFLRMKQSLKRETAEIRSAGRWLQVTVDPVLEEGNKLVNAVHIIRDITSSKATEEALRRNEEQYRQLFTTVPTGIFQSTPQGSYRAVNPAFASMFGFSGPDEMLSRVKDSAQLYVIPEELEKMRRILEEQGRVVNYEVQFRRPDGNLLWGLVNVHAVRDASGTARYYDGTIQDVTLNKLIMENLRENELRLQLTHKVATAGTWSWDIRTGLLSWSMEYYDLFGLSYDQPPDQGLWLQAVFEEDRGAVEEAVRKAVEEKHEYDITYRIHHPEKGQRWINGRGKVYSDNEGKASRMLAIAIDITDLKTSELKIREERDRAQRYFNSSAVIFLELGLDATIKNINSFASKVLGYEQDELIGKDWFQTCIPERIRDEVHKVFESMLMGESKIFGQYENPVLTKANTERIILWHNVLMRDESGEVTAVLSSGQDITERKFAERRVLLAQKRYVDLVNGIRVGVFRSVISGENRITDANPALLEMLEAGSKEEIKAYPLDSFCKDAASRKELIEKALRNGFIRDEEVELVTVKGNRFWAALSAVLSTDEHGQRVLDGIVEDISERKKTQKKLAHLNQQLSERNIQLQELALTDSQTGLYNHRYFSTHIEKEFKRAYRHFQPLSVMMLDLDFFKSINDVYGHAFGDLVLRQFSRQLRHFVRAYDTVIRFGGEEFIIVCPQTAMDAAVNLGQRILESINLYRFGSKKNTVAVKLSIAVASYPEDTVSNGQRLVELADQILHKVKEAGGNRVFCSLDTVRQGQKEIPKSAEVLSLQEKLEGLTRRANQSLLEAVIAFARSVEEKDRYSVEDAEAAVQYAKAIARNLGMKPQEIEEVGQAAMLHDLGKVGIAEKILHKKSKLTRAESAQVKCHPEIGVSMLRPVHALNHLIPAILHHHERWDGTGYPQRLAGKDIPQKARIVAITDVFQALLRDRPYRKKAFPREEAVRIIEKGAGTQFCPITVKAFVEAMWEK